MITSPQAHRIETTLTQDGILTLDHLPFRAGESDEFIVLTNSPSRAAEERYPLRGTAIRWSD